MHKKNTNSAIRPKIISHAFQSYKNAVAKVSEINRSEKDTIAFQNKHKITTQSPRSSDIDVVADLNLCLLPDVHGNHRADTRKWVAQEAQPVISKLFSIGAKRSRRIIVQGNVYGNYLRRIQQELDAHVIVVEKETETILQHIEGCDFQKDGTAPLDKNISNFTFIRGHLVFVLQQLTASSSIDNIIMASPKPYPTPTSSFARMVHREFFIVSHKALKVRANENDNKGIVVWTSYKPFWSFVHEQMDEAKLVVPYAKKKPSVFQTLLPTQPDVPQALESLHMFACSKKEATPAAADSIIANYNYSRQYYRPLFGY